MTECLRYTGVILCSLAWILLAMTVFGPRGDDLERETRHKGRVFLPILLVLDASFWYALDHSLPLNRALWGMIPALVLFDVVFGYYLVRDITERHRL